MNFNKFPNRMLVFVDFVHQIYSIYSKPQWNIHVFYVSSGLNLWSPKIPKKISISPKIRLFFFSVVIKSDVGEWHRYFQSSHFHWFVFGYDFFVNYVTQLNIALRIQFGFENKWKDNRFRKTIQNNIVLPNDCNKFIVLFFFNEKWNEKWVRFFQREKCDLKSWIRRLHSFARNFKMFVN